MLRFIPGSTRCTGIETSKVARRVAVFGVSDGLLVTIESSQETVRAVVFGVSDGLVGWLQWVVKVSPTGVEFTDQIGFWLAERAGFNAFYSRLWA